ncbi:MAG: 2OG-Fe(II) oxygenase [Polyangiaceae bacterium]
MSRAELGQQGDLVDAMARMQRVGAVVHGVLEPAEVSAALERAEAAWRDLPHRALCEGASTLGVMLAPTMSEPSGPELPQYLAAAESFVAPDVLGASAWQRVMNVLTELAGGRAVTHLHTADGRPYARATLRVFQSGAQSPPHNDTYPALPCLEELDRQRQRELQLSWYLMLSAPERGGQLALFPVVHGDPAARDAEAAAQLHAPTLYDVRPGDMIVFDGGRYLHRVERCEGPTPRRTLGGFASLTRDGSALLVWS